MPHIRIRTTLGLIMILFGVLQWNLYIIIMNVILGIVMLFSYKVPISFFIKKLKPLVVFFIFAFLFFPLYEGFDGLIKAMIYSGRLFFVAEILTYIFYKSSLVEFLQTLHFLKVPSLFIELIMFTLRYIELLISEVKAMNLSLKGRGFYAGSWFRLSKYLVLSKLLGSLFVRSIHRSERIYLGMLSRGYNQQLFLIKKVYIPKKEWLVNSIWLIVMVIIFGVFEVKGC